MAKEMVKRILEFLQLLFGSAADNKRKIFRFNSDEFSDSAKIHFYSFSQLKRFQRKLRRVVLGFFLVSVLVFLGIVLSQIFLPPEILPKVYIPNGKDDILISNISKSQATIVFKTLDSTHENKPLATKAFVSVYYDKEFTKLVENTKVDDYAVTHMIPIEGLKEGNSYYIQITAFDFQDSQNATVVSSWGNGDMIKFVATGDFVAACSQNSEDSAAGEEKIEDEEEKEENINLAGNDIKNENQSQQLNFSDVQQENYLYENNKIQAIISWKTNTDSSTSLIYKEGENGEEKEFLASEEKTKNHAVVLMKLKPAATYYFKVKSVDSNGNTVVSPNYHVMFTTRSKETVLQMISNDFQKLLDPLRND